MKFLVWLLLGWLLALAFSALPIGERRHYDALLSVWRSADMTMSEVEGECHRIARVSSDPELRAVAAYLARYASILQDSGYPTVARAMKSSKWEDFGRGFLLGFVDPWSLIKTIPLWWNADEFERNGKRVDERYGGTRYLPWVFGFALSGSLVWAGSHYWQRRQQGSLALAPRVRPMVNVTPV